MPSLYVPAHFAADAAQAAAIVARNPLAQVVVHGADGLTATPMPMLLRGTSLVGHVARGNPFWREAGEALAIFTGADGYVTPSWFTAKEGDGKVVPSWNYDTVQIRGTLVVHDDAPWKLDVVRLLTDTFESTRPLPWSVDDAPADYIANLLRAIVGIELVDVEVVGKRKHSQNRSDEDRRRLAAGLAVDDPALAAAMAEVGSDDADVAAV
jgi:transcriptional regulator